MSRAEAWPRTILHVDLDAFYASAHQRDDPSLSKKPVAVAPQSRRAVVLGASYEARAFGVRSAMPLHEALRACPQLIVVTPDRAKYKEASRQVLRDILCRFTSPDLIETVALDEAYLDVTARTRHGTSVPEEIGRRIQFAIRSEAGLSASVGVATSRLLAKVASASRKPGGLVLVPPGSEASFLAPLPVAVIPGLGPKTEATLALMGIRTVGDLASQEEGRLMNALGRGGAVLQRLAQGRDRAPVVGNKPAKTISSEVTFEHDVADLVQLQHTLGELVQQCAARLRDAGVRARTVYVKVKLRDFQLATRQVSRRIPTDDSNFLLDAARAALKRCQLQGRPIRLLGVGLSGLEHPQPDLQLTLFE